MKTIIDLLKVNNQNHLIEYIQNDNNISVIRSCEIEDEIVMYIEFKDTIVRNIVRGKKNIIKFFYNKYEKILHTTII